MPFLRLSGTVALLGPIISLACGGAPATTTAAPPASPPSAVAPQSGSFGDVPPRNGETVAGTVAETMNSGGYTYARLTGPDGDRWMAAPEMLSIKVGDQLTGEVSMPMRQFRSRTLNREFDVIYFVSRVMRNGEVLPPAPDTARGEVATGRPWRTPRPPRHSNR